MSRTDKKKLVEVRNLSKSFEVDNTIKRKGGILNRLKKSTKEFVGMGAEDRIEGNHFWALKDINFDVYEGETLGIIGVNGAGKSTLLKILSRILEPTEGYYKLSGRISSLLNVGTGFHPELSGRDNVYFNGALLGMSKKEIDEKFDEIVEFSELKSFINTPVKHYSSGMRSRLGFSVAMNLDAEIMIIDEALAVGDVSFKKKAMERMRNTAFTGRTVLFVSHSMGFVEEVCDRCILLDRGRVTMEGDSQEVIDAYLKANDRNTDKTVVETNEGDSRIKLKELKFFVNGKSSKKKNVNRKDQAEIQLKVVLDRPSSTYSIGYTLLSEKGGRLFRTAASDANIKLKKGENVLRATIPTEILKNGKYTIAADIDIKNDTWVINPRKTRAKRTFELTGSRDDIWDENREGIFKPKVDWTSQS